MFLCIALVVLELTLASGWPQTYHQSAEIEGMHQPACLTQIDFLRLELLNLFVFLLNLRIVSLSVLSLQSEFQDDQDYTEKPYLGKKKRERILYAYFLLTRSWFLHFAALLFTVYFRKN